MKFSLTHIGRCSVWRLAIAATACLCQQARSAVAQTPPVRVIGLVTDTTGAIGIAGADISVEGTSVHALSDERGEFRVSGDFPGGMQLRIRRLGFVPQSLTVGPSSDVTDLHIKLASSAQNLTPVVVRAERVSYLGRLAGYYERLEKKSIGTFITRADVEREQPRMLTQLLARQPGVQLVRGAGAATRNIRLRGRNCWPLVWLDGAAMSAGDVDLDAFAPSSLEGIEIYLGSASAPAVFQAAQGNSECGTIVLWSRGTDTDPPRPAPRYTPEVLDRLVASLAVYPAEQVDHQAVLDSASLPQLLYPQALRASGINGSVLAEFVVDENGYVETNTFNIVLATHPQFAAAVREVSGELRYKPATKADRVVRQVVRQPFEFVVPGHKKDNR